MPDQIFISYRRDDAAYVTGHINDLLRKEFGDEAVFTDVDNIALGVDFRAVLDETVSQCQVLLAVIGSGWLNATDKDGQLRLQDPADFVRIEIESALKRNIPVIPLLVSGAKMPAVEDLPESLRGLAFRNGTQIRPAPDFRVDMERLIKNLRRHFDTIRADQPGIAVADVISPAEAAVSEPPADTTKSTEEASPSEDPAATEDETPTVRIAVADDERARKRAELGMQKSAKPKRSGAAMWLVAVIALAGGAWFYASQNPGAVQSLLGAVQSTGAGDEQEVTSGEGTETDLSSGDDSAVAEESPAAAAAAIEVAEPGIAIDVEGDSEVETAAGDAASIAIEAADSALDAAAADAESSTEAAGDAAEGAPSDVTESAADAAPAEAVDAAPLVPVDDEVRLTPGSQRLSDSSAYISDGVRLAAIGDHEGAIENFDAAIELDVQPAFAFKQRAASYQALGQHEAALADYDEAIARNSEDVNAYYNRGATHLAVGDYAAAIADFDVVIQFDPEFVDAYSKRADAHEAVGNTEAAVRDRAVVEVFESNRGNPR